MALHLLFPMAALLFSACSDPGLRLAYDVRVESADTESIAVGLRIDGIDAESLSLQAFEPEQFIGLTGLQISDSKGRPVPHAKRVSPAGTAYRVSAPGSELRVEYKVQPGRPVGGGHGRHPTMVSGWISTSSPVATCSWCPKGGSGT